MQPDGRGRNESFRNGLERGWAELVAAEQQKLAEYHTRLDALTEMLSSLSR